MTRVRKKWPDIDDLTYCTVTRIGSNAVYVALEEYEGKEGMIHISEVSSSWVRNVRNHVRENQKIVCKVLRVVPAKDQVDLSIRRVTNQQRRDKIKMWKRAQKASKLLELVAAKLKKSELTAKRVEAQLEEHFGDALAGLEASLKQGESVLEEAGLTKEWATELAALAETQITVSTVSVDGVLDIRVPQGDGIQIIRAALEAGLEAGGESDAAVDIWAQGAPHYAIKVEAESYPLAESVLKKAIDEITQRIKDAGGAIEFERK